MSEQILKNSQSLLQIILDTIEGEVFVKDTNGKHLFVNKAFGKDFGVDPNDVIGKDDYFIFSPETAAELQENDKRIMAAKKAENIEESTVLEGRDVTYLTNKVPIIDDHGNVLGICGVGSDITRLKETEEKLRESEKKYRHLVKNSYDVVYSVTPDGIINFIGPQIERYGYEPEDLLSKNYIEFIAPEQRQGVVDSFERGTKDGTSFPTEFQWVGKGGKRHWVEAVGKTLYDDSENPTHQIGVLRDISERKQAEEALKSAQSNLEEKIAERTTQLSETLDKLHQTESRYRTVSDFAYDWIWLKNPDGTFEYISPSCERITGYSAKEFADDSELFDRIVFLEDKDIWHIHRQEGLEKKELQEIQFRIRRKNGEICWIEHSCQPVIDDRGAFLGFRASNRDITEKKALETESQRLRTELAHLDRVTTMGAMTASIAHEINQPLAAILSNAQAALRFLRHDQPDLDEVREALNDIISDDKRAAEVIRRLRKMVKKEELATEPFDLGAVIEEVINLVQSEIVIRNVSVIKDFKLGLSASYGDPVQMQQVILNLIVNALDVLEDQPTDARRILLSTKDGPNNGVSFSIADSGPGIEPDRIETIFNPFYTTKPKGMGLGLPISRTIVEAYGGHLRAENHPNGGAMFTLWLPLGKGE